MASEKITNDGNKRIAMLKVLNPFHIWGVGCGHRASGRVYGLEFHGR